MTALGNFTGGNVFDEVNALTVNVGAGTLTSSTRDAMLADISVNALLVGAEILQFRDAALQSPGIYLLTGFLRGLRGTEWAMAGHVAGERVILLQTIGMRRVTDTAADINAVRYWKAVTRGKLRSAVAGTTFVDTGVALKPFSPVDLRIANAGGDLNVTWLRRTRLATAFNGFVVPLGEAAEEYAVSVINTGSGAVIRRTIVSTPAWSYTKALQGADGVTSASAIAIRVAQRSAAVGDGYPIQMAATSSVVLRPQIVTLTLGGTYSAGVAMLIQLGSDSVSHTTTVGEASIAGVATAVAALIDVLPAYTATSAGAVITITGRPGATFTVLASISGSTPKAGDIVQPASGYSDGQSKEVRVMLGNAFVGGVNWTALKNQLFKVTCERRYQGFSRIDFSSQTFNAFGGESGQTMLGLISGAPRIKTGTTQDVPEWHWPDGFNAWPVAVFPRGETGWTISGFSSQSDAAFIMQTIQLETPIVTTPWPQIVEFGVTPPYGEPIAGLTYRITLGGVNYDYVGSAGQTDADVRAGLVALIDAAPAYNAAPATSAFGSLATVFWVTGAVAEVPFTFSAEIFRGSITLDYAITQQAYS